MDKLIETPALSRVTFLGVAGIKLAADVAEPVDHAQGTVLLLHGGGQTRHSWAGTARALARGGWRAVTLDQRGHGESDWAADGDYAFALFAEDLRLVAGQIEQRWGDKPVVIGASLGGIAGLMATGEPDPAPVTALVLVDITPRVREDGVQKVLGFMAAKAKTGFATLQEAADCIAEYLPHRPRPKNLSGLAKNLRQGDDGRYRWHWDPRFLDSRENTTRHVDDIMTSVEAAARTIRQPMLLVRGRDSELVGEEEAKAFVELVPHARVTDVSGARHMVAGDRNDVFTNAVLRFLTTL